MISGTASFLVRWLAPLMFLTSIFLSSFSLVGPVPTTHDVSLVSITPMGSTGSNTNSKRDFEASAIGRRVPRRELLPIVERAVSIDGEPHFVLAKATDGASVFIGALGSCEKQSNSADLVCQSPHWFPTYKYSFLPSSAPTSALPSSPPSTSPAFFLCSLILSTLFFLLFFILSLSDLLPRSPAILTKLNSSGAITRAITSLGLIGFIMGLMTAVVWRISFGRDVSEFNDRIASANGQPMLKAELANGFTMIWIGMAFQAPLLACQFFKLHMQVVASGKA